jgi:5-methylthioadenosine/S-adenosylhomocysteine deaminase
MIEELKYASTWNAAQYPPVFEKTELVKMATSVPAQLAAADKQIGSLSKGMYADLLLIKRNGTDAYQALLQSSPADVRLVVIGGVPVYGDGELMDKLLPGRPLESLNVCGVAKKLYIPPRQGIPETQKTFKQISDELKESLTASGTSLAELARCQGENLN